MIKKFSFGVASLVSFLLLVLLAILFSYGLFTPFIMLFLSLAVWTFTLILGFLSVSFDEGLLRVVGMIVITLTAAMLILVVVSL